MDCELRMNKLKILPCFWYFFICLIAWHLLISKSILGYLLIAVSISNFMIFEEVFDIRLIRRMLTEYGFLSILLCQLINQLIVFVIVNFGAIKKIIKNSYSSKIT